MSVGGIKSLSPVKRHLLELCYHALDAADEKKIIATQKAHYTGSSWEEDATPHAPRLEIRTTGISNELFINGVDCSDPEKQG